MRYKYVLIILLFIQCKKSVKNNVYNNEQLVIAKSNLNEKLGKFINNNQLDFENEQLYMINFCLTKSKDTMIYLHKTFYTVSYFINNEFIEYKGWLNVNKEIVLVYDYTNSLGENIYNKDFLFNNDVDKKYTRKHSNTSKYMYAKEYKISGTDLIETGMVGAEEIGEKILRILDSDPRNR